MRQHSPNDGWNMGNELSAEAPPARVGYFGGLRIQWDARVLEPREWTLEQAEWLAELACRAPAGRVLELCAGAGQLGIVAADLTGRGLVQVEDDPSAAGHARVNAAHAAVDTDLRVAALDKALGDGELFPLILADPPWVPTSEVADHPQHPPRAIDGGLDGLDLARICLRLTAEHLAPGGHAVLQVGTPDQAELLWKELSPDCPTLELGEVRDRTPRGTLFHVQARTSVPA